MSLLLFICTLQIFAIFSPASAQTTGPPPQDFPVFPVLLGTVDLKSYYYNSTLFMDWFAASRYCEQWGMRLGEIKTQAEQDFFDLKTKNEAFTGQFWMGARDSVSRDQFTWDGYDSWEQLKLGDFGQRFLFYSPQTCVTLMAYGSFGESETFWYSMPCENDWFSPLCEGANRHNPYRF
ncbi:uncharacterized protein LOC110861200 [Folsomia candida]|uniref:Hepatic lectin n=1 Tax=Folsomia candida TaxID=158441 RepID=A0A226D3U9_FOLCA|nr:uncharacterized protein LOC110861199 [Folsomia candida]XP_021966005.1 uncharacterized protein LOC110861200 [Folsomia candida]OXA39534.1 Hepatic lectin [Folsomia candida]OXA39607.1 Hepatic lectin [Folsomia candida]